MNPLHLNLSTLFDIQKMKRIEFTRDNLLQIIRAGLEYHGLTMKELERAVNISEDSIRDFFRGKCYIMRADKLDKVLSYLYPEVDFWASRNANRVFPL